MGISPHQYQDCVHGNLRSRILYLHCLSINLIQFGRTLCNNIIIINYLDERKLLDRLHRKRMELEEEERLKKKQEKQDLEKERQRKVGGPTKSTYIPDVHKPPSKYKADDTYEMQEKDDLEKESQQKMGGATMSTDVHNPASKYKTNDTYVLQEKEDLEKEKQQKMGGATKSTYTPDVHKIASKYKDIISYEITPVNKVSLAN